MAKSHKEAAYIPPCIGDDTRIIVISLASVVATSRLVAKRLPQYLRREGTTTTMRHFRASLAIAAALTLLMRGNSPSQSLLWEEIGGAPFKGIVWTIFSVPGVGVYAGTDGHGVYRSSDSGYSWIWSGLENCRVTSFCLDASGNIIAGTYGQGIFRSADSGVSWTAINTGLSGGVFEDQHVWAVSRHPSGDLYAGSNNGAVFRSTNNGGDWIESVRCTFPVYSMAIDGNGIIIVGTNGGGIQRSSNSGVTWVQRNISSTLPSNTVWALLATAQGHVFAGTYGSSVYRSSDWGETWTQLLNGLTNSTILSLAASSDVLLAGSRISGVFRSTNNGDTWVVSNKGNLTTEVWSLAFEGNNKFYAGTGRWLCRSVDGGLTWRQHQLMSQYVYSIKTVSDSEVWLGAGGMAVFRSTDAGTHWRQVHVGLGSGFGIVTSIASNSSGTILFGTDSLVRKSTDNGSHWVDSKVGLPRVPQVYGVLFDNHENLYACPWGEGVYRSSDLGSSWSRSFSFSGSVKTGYSSYLTPEGIVLVGGWASIARTTNEGLNWSEYTGLPKAYINSFGRTSTGRLFASTKDSGLVSSTDLGASWQRVVSSVTPNLINQMMVGHDDCIYLSKSSVCRSSDNGGTWQVLGNGLPTGGALAIGSASDGTIFIGTTGRGVFRSKVVTSISATSGALGEQPFNLAQNYPNPFNPSTTIKFELPRSSEVRLSVYDILSREVSVLVDGRREAGVYEVKFEGRGLASGVYLYRMQAGSFVQTRKLLLVR